jgi:hypothetical protein
MMTDSKNSAEANNDQVRFSSDCDLLEVKEEDTAPGKASERYRQWLHEKYGRKTLPPNGCTQETEQS